MGGINLIEIIIPERTDLWDEEHETFVTINRTVLQLEHSLISVKVWEERWHKPFLSSGEKTFDEIIDYIRCMTLKKGVDPNLYIFIPPEEIKRVIDYINDPHTATWFSDHNNLPLKEKKEKVTAEIIYYWMFSLGISIECQKWHLNQLLTLIKVISIKNSPEKKMSKKEELRQRTAINKARRAKYNSNG